MHGRVRSPGGGVTDGHRFDAEVAAIHRALFGCDAPDEIARLYAAAHPHALARVTGDEQQWMARAVEGRWDLEALEVAVRVLRGDHVLTRKMKLLVYLAEASPEYYARFVNEEPRRVTAFCRLAWQGGRTMLKLLKGWMILKTRRL